MTFKPKVLKGEGSRTVKWAVGVHPPRKRGGPRVVSAAAPRKPWAIEWELYETNPTTKVEKP